MTNVRRCSGADGAVVTMGEAVPPSTRKTASETSGPVVLVSSAPRLPADSARRISSIVPAKPGGSGSPVANDAPATVADVLVLWNQIAPASSCGSSKPTMPTPSAREPDVVTT